MLYEKGESPSYVERLLDLLPDYVVGAVWCMDLVAIISLTTTFEQAQHSIQKITSLITPFRFPDLAVGFMLVILGVIAPYALTRALSPLVDLFIDFTIVRFKFFRRPEGHWPIDELSVLEERARSVFGFDLPLTEWNTFLLQYLVQSRSPLAPPLDRWDRSNSERLDLIFPVSLLAAFVVYAIGGQTLLSFAVGTAVSVLVATVLVHRSNTVRQEWGRQIAVAFLIATAGDRYSSGAKVSHQETEVSAAEEGGNNNQSVVAGNL